MFKFRRTKIIKRLSSGIVAALFLTLQLPVGLLAEKAFAVPADTGDLQVNKMVDSTGAGTYVATSGTTAAALGFTWKLDSEVTSRQFGTTTTTTAGTHSVTEDNTSTTYQFTGWYDDSGNNDCSNPDGTTLPISFDVKKNKTNVLTLCNQKIPDPTGSLTIVKDAQPDDNQQFGFTSNVAGHTSFKLKDDGSGTGNSEAMSGLTLNQSYTVTEDTTSGWTLADITCGAATAVEDVANRTVTVTLSSAQKDVTCTFTNTENDKSVTICHRTNSVSNPYNQQTVNYSAATGAQKGTDHTGHTGPVFDPNASYPTPHNGDQWGDIIPPYSWSGGSYPGLNWDAQGQAIYNNNCVSTQTGSITIVKSANPTTTQTFGFTSTIPNNTTFSLSGDNVAADDTKAMSGLMLDQTYTVTEDAVTGWTLTSIDCGGATVTTNTATRTVSIDLSSVQKNVTCTFSNLQPGRGGGNTYSISGYKFNDLNGNGVFDSGESKLSGWTINLFDSSNTPLSSTQTDTSGNYSFSNLQPGDYKVCESQKIGWTQKLPAGNNCYNITLTNADFTTAIFGNEQDPAIQASTVTSLTPGKGAATTQLVNTGSSAFLNIAAGLTILGSVAALTQTSRRRKYTS